MTLIIRPPPKELDVEKTRQRLEALEAAKERLEEDIESRRIELRQAQERLEKARTWIQENPAPEDYDEEWTNLHILKSQTLRVAQGSVRSLDNFLKDARSQLNRTDSDLSKARTQLESLLRAYYRRQREEGVASVKTLEGFADLVDRSSVLMQASEELQGLANRYKNLTFTVGIERNRVNELEDMLGETIDLTDPRIDQARAGSAKALGELRQELARDEEALTYVKGELLKKAADLGLELEDEEKHNA